MSITVRQARYFVATADFGQVSLAARELNVSQSAVTTAIKQLEELLDVTLFLRVATGVEMTAEGARFLQHARNIIAAVNEAVQSPLTVDKGVAGTLKVGISYTVAGYFLPRYHARFSRFYPQIDLQLIELPRNAIEYRLITGELDLAVILVSNLRNKAEITFETLLQSRRRLWVSPGHELLGESSVPVNLLSTEPYIMLTVDEAHQTANKYWEGWNLKPNVVFSTSSIEAVRSMVAAGMGITVLSDMVYRPWSLEGQRIETLNVEADIPTMDVGVAWAKDAPLAIQAKSFLDFMNTSFSAAPA